MNLTWKPEDGYVGVGDGVRDSEKWLGQEAASWTNQFSPKEWSVENA